LSGRPCWERSNNLISKTKEVFGDSLTIIGVGGIFSPDDALEKMKRGADLVQLITGMFMEGPHLISQIDYKIEESKYSQR
jgi:dihydroorotate dehydrogenase